MKVSSGKLKFVGQQQLVSVGATSVLVTSVRSMSVGMAGMGKVAFRGSSYDKTGEIIFVTERIYGQGSF